MPTAPQLKYRNRPTTLGGHRFASRAEARRYGELLLLERAGTISNIVVQPRFKLIVSDMIVGTYTGDFAYHENNNYRVEDVKSPITKTTTYKIKKKLMKALYNIEVIEIE